MKHSLRLLSALLLLTTLSAGAQTTHFVTAAGVAFTPSTLEIAIGDTVRFFNEAGLHNVNGTQTTFPANPESFGNQLGTGWTYAHKFNTAGTYQYRCDQHFGMGMTGTIVVTDTVLSVGEASWSRLQVYPNPAVDVLRFSEAAITVEITDMQGRVVAQAGGVGQLSVAALPAGYYFYQISTASGRYSGRFARR